MQGRRWVRMAVVLAACVSGSAGCGELHEDGDFMCVVPSNCTPDTVDSACTDADYPADTPLAIRVWIQGDDDEVSEEECWTEITGELELTVRSRWRERDSSEAIPLSLIPVDCATPPLSAGEWTVVFGEHELRLLIPRDQGPVVCTGLPDLDGG